MDYTIRTEDRGDRVVVHVQRTDRSHIGRVTGKLAEHCMPRVVALIQAEAERVTRLGANWHLDQGLADAEKARIRAKRAGRVTARPVTLRAS